jgi:hypothetical protein
MKEPKEIETAVEAFEAARDILLMRIFKKFIKPIADRYDWEIEWGMGGVYFTNKHGEDLSESRTVENLEKVLNKYTDIIYQISDCGSLWDVMSGLPVKASFYHKSYGFSETSNLNRK